MRQLEGKETSEVSYADVYQFIMGRGEEITQATRNLHFTLLKAFFNFCRDVHATVQANPCQNPLLRKAFRAPRGGRKINVTKEVVDEVIFRTPKARDRLILELQARSGLRIGEVLTLRVKDVEGRRLTLSSPKSGRDAEEAYMPESVTHRLEAYIREEGMGLEDRMFFIPA